jgi:hypothetical protein
MDASGFPYSSAEVRKVARVQFGVFNPDEVVSSQDRAAPLRCLLVFPYPLNSSLSQRFF